MSTPGGRPQDPDMVIEILDREEHALDADRYQGTLSRRVRLFSAIAGLDPREMNDSERTRLPLLGVQLVISFALALFGLGRFAHMSGVGGLLPVVVVLTFAIALYCLDRALLGRGYKVTDDIPTSELVAWTPAMFDDYPADPRLQSQWLRKERGRLVASARSLLKAGTPPSARFYLYRFLLGVVLALLLAIGIDSVIFGGDARKQAAADALPAARIEADRLDQLVKDVNTARVDELSRLNDQREVLSDDRNNASRGQHNHCRPKTTCADLAALIKTNDKARQSLDRPLEQDPSDKRFHLVDDLKAANGDIELLLNDKLPPGTEGGLGSHLDTLARYMIDHPVSIFAWLLITMAVCALDLGAVIHKYAVRGGSYEKKIAQRERLVYLRATRRRWLATREATGAHVFVARQETRKIERVDSKHATDHAQQLMSDFFVREAAAEKMANGDEALSEVAVEAVEEFLRRRVDEEVGRLRAEQTAAERADLERARLREQRAEADARAAEAERRAAESWAAQRRIVSDRLDEDAAAAERSEERMTRASEARERRETREQAEVEDLEEKLRQPATTPPHEQPDIDGPTVVTQPSTAEPEVQTEPPTPEPPTPETPGGSPPQPMESVYGFTGLWEPSEEIYASTDGMTRVLKAENRDTGRVAALKFGLVAPQPVGGERDARGRDEVHNEISILNSEYPGMPELIDADGEGSTPWFAIPYFEGGNLAAWRAKHGSRRLVDELGIVLQVLDQWGRWDRVIDVDRKPANVMLTGGRISVQDDVDILEVQQIDFGQAVRIGTLGSKIVVPRGTPDFTHPDALSHESNSVPGYRSMVWSACMMLWEGIAGELPGGDYGDADAFAVSRNRAAGIANGAMRLASAAPPSVPRSLCDFVDDYLAKSLGPPGSEKQQRTLLRHATSALNAIFDEVIANERTAAPVMVGALSDRTPRPRPSRKGAVNPALGKPVLPTGAGRLVDPPTDRRDDSAPADAPSRDRRERGGFDPQTGKPSQSFRLDLSDVSAPAPKPKRWPRWPRWPRQR